MANKLIVSLSPHVHSGDSIQKNMYGVLIALIPALLVSFYMFGLGAVVVTLTSVAACVFFEWAITKFILKRERSTTVSYTHLHPSDDIPSDTAKEMGKRGMNVKALIKLMAFYGLATYLVIIISFNLPSNCYEIVIMCDLVLPDAVFALRKR